MWKVFATKYVDVTNGVENFPPKKMADVTYDDDQSLIIDFYTA